MNWILLTLAFAAHFGLRLAFYNRLNSWGLPRPKIKKIEKLAFAETCLTPIVISTIGFDSIHNVLWAGGSLSGLPLILRLYGTICLIVGGVFFLLWLAWRPIFKLQHAEVFRQTAVHRPSREDVKHWARTEKCRWAMKIPGNQIFDLAVENIDIPLANLPSALDGYRIAHLSDTHLTGQCHPDYLAGVIKHAMKWQPEMFALTGDIVDVQECVGWLKGLFSQATARDGCYFLLGNHDTRVSDPGEVRREMQAAGWRDLGGRCEVAKMRQTEVMMMGNESPWFHRPRAHDIHSIATRISGKPFRVCFSHSPDQYDWARGQDVDLLLCGHTHGGQGRLPLAGPLLSPSRHGSRWASGDFYRAPTTMHVSRGLGGVHLLRIRCRPELSLLTLRCQSPSSETDAKPVWGMSSVSQPFWR